MMHPREKTSCTSACQGHNSCQHDTRADCHSGVTLLTTDRQRACGGMLCLPQPCVHAPSDFAAHPRLAWLVALSQSAARIQTSHTNRLTNTLMPLALCAYTQAGTDPPSRKRDAVRHAPPDVPWRAGGGHKHPAALQGPGSAQGPHSSAACPLCRRRTKSLPAAIPGIASQIGRLVTHEGSDLLSRMELPDRWACRPGIIRAALRSWPALAQCGVKVSMHAKA